MFPSNISDVPGRFLPAGNCFHRDRTAYLSPAPQAEPQAEGFSSDLSAAPQAEPQAAGFSSGLSAAPQAEPQAAGFSSGLSAAPQAEPQAAAGVSSIFLFHPNRLESAMIVTSILCIQSAFALCNSYFTDFFQGYKYAHFCNVVTF